MNFFDKLANLCKLRNITIENLWQQIGRTTATYYSWRSRNVLPRADEVFEMSKILKVPMEYFFDSEDSYCIVPPELKPLIQKIESLPTEDIEIITHISESQLQSVIALCKSIKS